MLGVLTSRQILDPTAKTTTIDSVWSKVFDYALKIFIVVSTFFYLPFPSGIQATPDQVVQWMYDMQELFFRYGVFVLFGLSFFSKPKRHLKSVVLGLLLVYCISISTFMSFDLVTRRTLMNFSIGIFFYKMVVERAEADISKYAFWLYWLLVANLVLSFLQTAQLDPIFGHVRPELMPYDDEVGFMRLKATLGGLASVISPILFVLSPWLSLVSLPLLWYGESSTAILGFAAGTLFVLYYQSKRWIYFFLVLILFLTGGAAYVLKYDMPGGQFQERFKVWWTSSSRVLKQNPYFGLGGGKFAHSKFITPQGVEMDVIDYATAERRKIPVKLPYPPLSWIWAHNEFLQFFFEFGIVGFVLIVLFLKNRVTDFRRFRKDNQLQCLFGCLIAIVVFSFFHFPFHLGKTVGLCLFLMALFHARVRHIENLGD